ncbi:C39 family peptidase [Atrimonas thermophila]|jgi:hypothetical protein|uniref:C39 family peptidase n=1 Tax=Atrimonas thermophila TaxID=3064161 RepID=UPI00399CBDB8
MKKRLTLLGFIAGLVVVLLVAGCSTTFNIPLDGSTSLPTGKFLENSASRVLLDVPFLPQVPPGDWSNTRNCGVASAVMIKAYYFGSTPTPEDIIEADQWLHNRFGLPLNGGNGDYTNVFQIRAWLEQEGVPTRIGMGNLEVLRKLLSEGKPVLVAVYSNMNPAGGAKHAMVAVGIDNANIYVNDPGKVNGKNNTYPISQFLAAWSAQNNWYVTIE